MRRHAALLFFVFLACREGAAVFGAEMIAQWGFNNSTEPSFGQGVASLVGGVTASYATGSTNDPAEAGNTGWNTTQYPAQGAGNQTAGVQFAVSTLGYSDIVVRWEHRVSNTASKYCQLQFSADGTHFANAPVPICATAVSAIPSFYESQTIDLSQFTEVNDNPHFAFRVVSEFEGSALGNGVEQYVTTYGTNRYSSNGTIRFDLVTVSGVAIAGTGKPPAISPVADQVLRVGQSTGPLSFTVSDMEDPPENLTVSAVSSDASVVPAENISLAGEGRDRTLNIIAGMQDGTAFITLRVTDTAGRSGTTRFTVSVLAANTAPFISVPCGTNMTAGTDLNVALAFTVGDWESPSDGLLVAAASRNPTLVPNDGAHLSLHGGGSNRVLVITPAEGAAGAGLIALSVTDGMYSNAVSFPFSVTPAADCVLYESFEYSNGSMVTNSGLLWWNRSGKPGDCEVANRTLTLSANRTEDVLTPIPGRPYEPGRRHVLYASFKVRFLGQPEYPPTCFASFFCEGSARARIYAGPSEVWAGAFRLYLANGSATYWPHAAVLSTNTWYTVVTKYDVDSASAALWVSPASEATPAAVAGDTQPPAAITAFGFCQDSGLGTTLIVDDLRSGLSFNAVTAGWPARAIRLGLARTEGGIVLRWVEPELVLQAGPELGGPFTNVPAATSPFIIPAAAPALYFRAYRPFIGR